jgi:hypothetical protein
VKFHVLVDEPTCLQTPVELLNLLTVLAATAPKLSAMLVELQAITCLSALQGMCGVYTQPVDISVCVTTLSVEQTV